MSMRILAWAVVVAGFCAIGAGAPPEPAAAPDLAQWANPPGAETPEVARLIDEAVAKINGGEEPGLMLCEPRFMPMHPYPRFRDAVKSHAPVGSLTYAAPPEPGERLTIRLHLQEPDGRPAPGVLVYLYQTSARGGYAQDAAHVRATAGDIQYARLFGYVVTDASGSVVVRTIRPAGYPRSELPAHVHLAFTRDDRSIGGTEIQFSDDPRLAGAMLERSRRERAIIASPTRSADGWQVEVTHRL